MATNTSCAGKKIQPLDVFVVSLIQKREDALFIKPDLQIVVATRAKDVVDTMIFSCMKDDAKEIKPT